MGSEKTKGCLTGCLGKVLLIGFLLILLALFFGPRNRGNPGVPASPPVIAPSSPADSFLAGVSTFLGAHPEFGSPSSSWDVPDWARGARQGVIFDSGRRLLFYLKGDTVVTVYDVTPGSERRVVWGRTESSPAAPAEPDDAEAADPSGMSAEYRAGLKRTAERRRARSESGRRRFAESGEKLQQEFDAMMKAADTPAAGPGMGGTGPSHVGPRGGVFHLSPSGKKVYEQP